MGAAYAASRDIGSEIKFEYGQAIKLCLKFNTGREVPGRGGPRYMYTTVDSRRFFLDLEDSSDVEHALIDLRIKAGEDFVRITKIRHPRGGGHTFRVERVDDADEPGTMSIPKLPPRQSPPPANPSSLEAKLEQSVQVAREYGPQAFVTQPPAAPGVVITPACADMVAAMCAAVDAVIETQAYATRRGLGVTFSEESVRAIGLSIYIGSQRAGR